MVVPQAMQIDPAQTVLLALHTLPGQHEAPTAVPHGASIIGTSMRSTWEPSIRESPSNAASRIPGEWLSAQSDSITPTSQHARIQQARFIDGEYIRMARCHDVREASARLHLQQ